MSRKASKDFRIWERWKEIILCNPVSHNLTVLQEDPETPRDWDFQKCSSEEKTNSLEKPCENDRASLWKWAFWLSGNDGIDPQPDSVSITVIPGLQMKRLELWGCMSCPVTQLRGTCWIWYLTAPLIPCWLLCPACLCLAPTSKSRLAFGGIKEESSSMFDNAFKWYLR